MLSDMILWNFVSTVDQLHHNYSSRGLLRTNFIMYTHFKGVDLIPLESCSWRDRRYQQNWGNRL